MKMVEKQNQVLVNEEDPAPIEASQVGAEVQGRDSLKTNLSSSQNFLHFHVCFQTIMKSNIPMY